MSYGYEVTRNLNTFVVLDIREIDTPNCTV